MSTVSIIMPCFNSSAYIKDAIESVISQSFEDWELIVINDASTDNTVDIIESIHRNDDRVTLINLTQNVGVAKARNIGIQSAKGRFIAFLDSDDLWYPTKLEKQINFMIQNSIELCYTGYKKINESGILFQTMRVPLMVSYKDLLKTCYIGCLTAIYDTEKLGKVYMPTNTKREDYATWLSILKQTKYGYAVPEILAEYRVYSSQSSAKKINMAKENWNLYRKIENLGLLESLYYFSNYALNGILRTNFPNISSVIDRYKGYK